MAAMMGKMMESESKKVKESTTEETFVPEKKKNPDRTKKEFILYRI